MALFDFLNSGSDKLAAEIERERQSADAANKAAADAEAAVQAERDNAILAGDEKAVDKIDAKLAERTSELRRKADIHTKRVALLEGKLAEARDREEQQNLDTIAARATKASQMAAEITRKEYLKNATALAQTLTKLHALDEFIAAQNRILSDAERERVPDATHSRHVVPSVERVRKRRRVNINDPLHPHHHEREETYVVHVGDGTPDTVTLKSGAVVPRWVEIEFEDEVRQSPTWAKPLWLEITRLPGVGADDRPIYQHGYNGNNQDVEIEASKARAKIITEMGV